MLKVHKFFLEKKFHLLRNPKKFKQNLFFDYLFQMNSNYFIEMIKYFLFSDHLTYLKKLKN
jgi:hypothetical protein